MKTTHNPQSELEQIDNGTRFARNSKKRQFIKSYEEYEIVKSHDRQCPDETQERRRSSSGKKAEYETKSFFICLKNLEF